MMEATRDGFGRALLLAAEKNPKIVALSADLAESTRLLSFAQKYPERFFDIGVSEQNLVTVASGLAHIGFVPFATSFAAFSPGRNWEQIRTTICYNNQNVKIVGSHTGLGVGEDGATHQMLEDVALMRVLPNMTVVVPCDCQQAFSATHVLAQHVGPAYLRLTRQKTADVVGDSIPFILGKAQVLHEGNDVTIISCGPVLTEVVKAAEALLKKKIHVRVLNMHTIKPIDTLKILESAARTGAILVVEDHQITGGLGSAVAEVIVRKHPVPMELIGMNDSFGESGSSEELFEKYGLTAEKITEAAIKLVRRKEAKN